jgi:hypothetical protein
MRIPLTQPKTRWLVTGLGIILVTGLLLVISRPLSRQANTEQKSALSPIETVSKDFSRGVLALNTDKAQYLPGEKMTVNMTSLDNTGHTLCHSNLKLEITNPQNIVNDVKITESPSCGDDNVTNDPDYLASFSLENVGRYGLKLTNLDSGNSSETEVFVYESLSFDIKRAGAIRINPAQSSRYPMHITLKANQDYKGIIKEQIPAEFKVIWQGDAQLEGSNLIWNVDLKAGEAKTLAYEYTAPQISPELYILGPLTIGNQQINSYWQIAADNSEGVRYPSSGTEVDYSGGTIVWNNETNIYSDNGSYADTSALAKNAISEYLRGSGFGFTVPNCSSIDGIYVEIDHKGSTANYIKDSVVSLVNGSGSVVGDNKASTANYWSISDEVYTYGGSSDTWTAGLSCGDVTDTDFGVVIAATNVKSGGPADGYAYVDYMRVTVYYTATSTITVSGNVYDTTESSVITSGPLVRVKVDGAAGDYTDNADVSGYYEITGVPANAGASLTVYLDTGSSPLGATFTRSTGANMSNIHIYQNRMTTRCDNSSCSLTNGDINDWDKSNDGDIHAASDGTNLTLDNDWKLLVAANTYAPGGTVTTTNGGSNSYSGDIEIKSGAILNMAGNTLSIGGAGTTTSRPLIVGGTYNPGTNTTTYTGTATSDIDSTPSYYGLTINSSGVTFSPNNNLTITDALTLTNGTLDLGSYTANRSTPGGTLTIASGTTLRIGSTNTLPSNYSAHSVGSTSTVEYYGTTQTVAGLNSSQSYGNLTISGSGTKTVGAAITVANNLTVSAGILADNGNQITGNASGTLSLAASTGLTLGSAGVGSSFPTNFTNPNCSLNSSSTVTYNSGQAQTVSGTPTYGNVTIDGGSTKTLGAATVIAGTLSVTAGDTLSTSGSNYALSAALVDIASTGTLNIQGSTFTITGTSGTLFTNAGTFTAGTNSTTKFTGATAPTALLSGTFTGASSFYNLEMSPTISGAVAYAVGAAFNANNNFTVSPTSSGANTLTVTLGGNSSVTGTTSLTGVTSGKSALDTKSGSNYTFSTGILTIDTPGTFNANNSNPITINAGSGTILSQSGTFNAGGSTVAISGSGALSFIVGTTFNNLTISGTETVSQNTTVTLNGALNCSSCSLSPSSGTFEMATNGWSLANSGTLDFNNLTISETPSSQSNVSFIVSGTLAVSSTKNFSPPGGTITFHDGSDISNSGTLAFQALTINTSAAVSGSGNFSVAGSFDINSGGVFTPAAGEIISGNGTLTGYGTAQVTRTASVADFSTQYAISNKTLTNLIVEYTAASAQTVSALAYGYLKISTTASAVATLANDASVGKNLTISSGGTLSLGGHQLTVSGSWLNSGSFVHANGTVLFDDAGQTSSISGANTFYNFTCATAGKTLQFANGVTQNMVASGGLLSINGQSGNNITIKSDSGGNKWFVNHQGTESVSYVTVYDSGCNSSTDITVTSGDDSLDNNDACWVFGGEPPAGEYLFNIDGNFYLEGIDLN